MGNGALNASQEEAVEALILKHTHIEGADLAALAAGQNDMREILVEHGKEFSEIRKKLDAIIKHLKIDIA